MFRNSKHVYDNTKVLFPRFGHSWVTPDGFKTPINIYNCVTRKKEPFIVKKKDAVTWYTCGPTVYDSSHIGHASCYVKLDIIQKILQEHFGLNLVTCMNITDIDDKIIKKANELKEDYREISKKFEKEFWEDMNSLGVKQPDVVIRVTENMHLIVDFIERLVTQEIAYVAQDNSVYFSVSEGCKQYGKLQNIGETFPDPKNPNKKCPMDFALWKSSKPNEPFFESPWGPGRPGWHIECSALASYVFGNNIDVHAGGIDLRFPHHENEEAQSCAFHQTNQWVNYWIHTGHLYLKDSIKMSKSLKNTILIQDLLKDASVQVFRLLCAMTHYYSPVEYSTELIETSSNLLKVYKNFLNTCVEVQKGLIQVKLSPDILCELLETSTKNINAAYCDDFNTPKVIEILNNIVTQTNLMIYSSTTLKTDFGTIFYILALKNIVSKTLNTFGIDLTDASVNRQDNSDDFIEMLVNFRTELRTLGLQQKNKDILNLCDNIRLSLGKNGVILKDYKKLTSWTR